MIPAVIIRIVTEAPGIVTFWLQPAHRVRFTPGDFVELYVPHAGADSRGDHREMSISSAPSEGLIALTVKFMERGGSTFKQALLRKKPGDTLQFTEPMGAFVLPKNPETPVVLIGGGVGVAPYRAMVLQLGAGSLHAGSSRKPSISTDSEQERSATLIYCARSQAELIFTDVFEQFFASDLLRYIPVLTQPDAAWHGKTGRLTGERILELAAFSEPSEQRTAALFYLSGPEAMFAALRAQLLAAGVASQQIVLDYFPGYTDL